MDAKKRVPIQSYVLYASETGNCEQISEDLLDTMKNDRECEDICRKISRHKLNDHVENKDGQKKLTGSKFNLEDKSAMRLCIIIASTTGNGDFPENGEMFYRFLRRKSSQLADGQKSTLLNHVFYTILGLGSTDYSLYQAYPRYVDSKMQALGANFFYYRGEADDTVGLEKVVEPWLEGLQPALLEQYKKMKKFSAEDLERITAPCTDLLDMGAFEDSGKSVSSNVTYFATATKQEVINAKAKEKYGEATKDVIEIELSFGRKVGKDKISAGQSLAIFPQNLARDVDKCVDAFGWNGDELLGNKTLKELLTSDVDIRSNKVNLKKLELSADVIAKLNEKYNSYVTLVDLANEITTLGKLIPQFMVEESAIIPKIKPRFYSISSDPFQEEGQNETKTLQFAISMTQYEKAGEASFGFCSEFLKDPSTLANKVEIKCQFSRAYRILQLPTPVEDGVRPLLMLAQGTGVSPFVSMLQSLVNQGIADRYQVVMVFGLRDNSASFIYKDELLEFFSKSPRSHLYLACSREVDEAATSGNEAFLSCDKGYVQDMLLRNSKCLEAVKNVLEQEAMKILVCGSQSAMGKEATGALAQLTDNDRIDKMKKNGDLLMELWGE